jgi:hypothetical protein
MAVAWLVSFAPGKALAAELPDGLPIRVRLLGIITSENARRGDPVEFVVTSDIVSGDDILIGRGTVVTGVVVDSRRARWGFHHHHPRLAFKFQPITARNGMPIALRSSPYRSWDDRVIVDRDGRHHELRWAAGADIFVAYVDGSYEL